MTPVFDIRMYRGRGTVLRDGVEVFGPTTLAQAEQKVEALRREARMKDRPCITCRTVFRSEGPHHRMCQRCRKGGGAEDFGII